MWEKSNGIDMLCQFLTILYLYVKCHITFLLNEDVYIIDDFDAYQVHPQIPSFSIQELNQQKKRKATNFSVEEGLLLVSVW